MKINVKGIGIEYYSPDQVTLNINFYTKSSSYEEVLTKGTDSIQTFIKIVLIPLGFSKEELKTQNIIIREEKKYNEQTHQYNFDGYSYHQTAKIKFDYSQELLSKVIEKISKLSNPPSYHIAFGIKNDQEVQKRAINKAYQNAKTQATTIAESSSKKLVECTKVDYQPFSEQLNSVSNLEGQDFLTKNSNFNLQETIINTFIPEDIEITKTIYCQWIAD